MRTLDPDVVPVVPGFAVETLLGTGATAQVWRARAEPFGEPVALKVMGLADGAAITAARAEAALLAALDHPHLMALHGLVGVEHADPLRPAVALVLDLAEGGSLAALLRRRGRLSPGEVVTAIAPVGAALAYVHDEGLVHGDVTPANILFTDDGVPQLADLGVARVLGGYGEVRTTAAYADPAVAAGGRPSPAADVFMLAATAFHALTGEPPWPDPLPGAAFARAAAGDVTDLHAALTGLPGALVDVLVEALRPQPHLRPSAAAFALDLRRAVTPVAVEFGAGRAPGRPRFDRPRWTGTPQPTSQRATHVVAARPGAVPSPPGRAVPAARHASRGRRSRRGALLAVTALVATAVAVVVWSVGGGAGTDVGPVAVSGPSVAAPSTWAAVLDDLDARRAAAYAARDPQALSGVYAGGVLLDQDRAELAAVVPTGCTLAGARTSYADVSGPSVAPVAAASSAPASVAAGPVVVTARATLAPSSLRCAGTADRPVAGIAATALRITLVGAGDGYRISALQPG